MVPVFKTRDLKENVPVNVDQTHEHFERTTSMIRSQFVSGLAIGKSLFLAGLFLCAGATMGRSQVYFFTAPVTGYQELGLSDRANSSSPIGGAPPFGSTTLGFGTITETIYLDPVAGTIRQVGSVTLSSATTTTSFTGYSVSSPATTATLTANLSVAGGGDPLTFDTGAVPYQSGPGGISVGTFFKIPILGTYSLLTGGQTYNGALAFNQVDPFFVTQISSLTPDSLTISQSGGPNSSGLDTEFGSIQANITAADGYHLLLENGQDDGTEFFQWNVGSVTALAVPEPASSFWLLVIGLAGIGFCRRLISRTSVTGHR